MDKADSQPPVKDLLATAKLNAQQQKIADLKELQNDSVWIFHGTQDPRVTENVTLALVDFYKALVPKKNIAYINNLAAGHGFPTVDTGVKCASTQAPYINKCNYDAAGALLSHLYGNLKMPSTTTTELQAFDQTLYNTAQSGLASTGYLYVPKKCLAGESCKLHVSFHGCKQNAESMGTQFAQNTGYNRWAESNNIVILYPQTTVSLLRNPYACWDWWGYTDENFAQRNGKQIQSVWNMVNAL